MNKLNSIKYKVKITFINIVLLFLTTNSWANKQSLAKSKEWTSILLYFRDDHQKSLINSHSNFFISSSGEINPTEEMDKSVKIFTSPDEYLKLKRGHPQCLFPARFKFLNEKLKLNIKPVKCPALEEWRFRMEGEDLSVIFASQFISNPASVMGHTFLKFGNSELEPFLQSSVGYAADVPKKDGPFAYAYNGLTGGYPGLFVKHLYYEKVHEYNNMEQRDIWEYSLNISKVQRALLVDMLWEIQQNATFSYFFLDENCSYVLLALIEAIHPESDLLHGFSVYTGPYETLHRLKENKLIKEETFRASVRATLFQKYNLLNSTEKKELLKSIHEESLPSKASPLLNMAFINYILFKKYRKSGKLDAKWKELYDEALVQKSKQPDVEIKPLPVPPSPLNAHRPLQLDFHVGEIKNSGVYQKLTFRPGIHSLMDKPDGFLKNSSFSFFETEVRYFPEMGTTELSRFTAFNLQNTQVLHRLDPDLSWKLKYESYRRDLYCQSCILNDVIFMMGGTLDIKKIEVKALGGIREIFSSEIKYGHVPMATFEVELLTDIKLMKFRLSQQISLGLINHEETSRSDSIIETRFYEVLKHTHLGMKLHYQRLLEVKTNYFDHSLFLTYDF